MGCMDARHLLAWNVRKLRVTRGVSQEKLALEAGIDRAYFGRIERAKENLSLATVDVLATALAVRVSDLFAMPADGEEPPKSLQAGRKRK